MHYSRSQLSFPSLPGYHHKLENAGQPNVKRTLLETHFSRNLQLGDPMSMRRNPAIQQESRKAFSRSLVGLVSEHRSIVENVQDLSQ
jgi:hypothetical protein